MGIGGISGGPEPYKYGHKAQPDQRLKNIFSRPELDGLDHTLFFLVENEESTHDQTYAYQLNGYLSKISNPFLPRFPPELKPKVTNLIEEVHRLLNQSL